MTEIFSGEGETDVLVVFETDAQRFALHIENKRLTGRFTPKQPELYRERARAWANQGKYGNYDAWETVLVAPQAFYNRFRIEADKFGCFIAHEEIAKQIPLFGALRAFFTIP
jgi:hypothetical protein